MKIWIRRRIKAIVSHLAHTTKSNLYCNFMTLIVQNDKSYAFDSYIDTSKLQNVSADENIGIRNSLMKI